MKIGLEFADIIVKSRQRASADEFDRVVERAESVEEWIEDDHREYSCWKLEKQRDR